ncbi:unnamed protein product [Peronospora belbahrii]|uniref:RanBD1 domain-containing protein n=1 Tax=Peronospora belbahrii TaxID=622444 RepID=A0AAU9KUF3_9STRA|nr:unnamed protein product [Peronospora belbahrii]CAH0519692.1 unnamed protein product [Peronospora belbahrii]
MATKGEHEKPETMEDEHQPIVKKVRLDVDAKVTEDVKKVKIDEDATSQPEIGGQEDAVEKDSSVLSSPVMEEQEKQEAENVQENNNGMEKEEAKINASGSAFGGFGAFSNKNAFVQVTAPASSNGFGVKALSSTDVAFGANVTQASSGLESTTSLALLSDATTSSSSGFALFQSNSSVTFASFAATQPSTEGFGAKASLSSSTTFSDTDVLKKADPVVAALSKAELANGEEGEQVLVEKRAKLFKLVEKDYAEVGIGPVRVLNANDAKTEEAKATARIVMRRESYPHGPGTKLLVNASLGACLLCEKKTEKTMLLTVLESTEDVEMTKQLFVPVTYLMRFESPDDLDVVSARIQANLHSSTSVASSFD